MIFRSRKNGKELFDQIEELGQQNRVNRDPELERRILRLAHRAGVELTAKPAKRSEHPDPSFDQLPEGGEVPEVTPDELSPGLLRAAILNHGCLLVRGLVDPEEAGRLAGDIDRAFEGREALQAGEPAPDGDYEPFEPDPDSRAITRGWIADAGGVWAADSPRVMCEMLDVFERTGLRELATEYLGERPALSLDKCTLRRVKPDTHISTWWHQDGSFLGDGVRALNVWLALTRCGDVAPGLDIVPRRIDHIVETGTEGAAQDWSVSQEVAEEAAGDAPISRPIFDPGDVLLFDDLCLHKTGADPEMPNTRYAIESWFFGPSGFPGDYVPLAF